MYRNVQILREISVSLVAPVKTRERQTPNVSWLTDIWVKWGKRVK